MKALLFPPDTRLGFPPGKWKRVQNGILLFVERMTPLECEAFTMIMEAVKQVAATWREVGQV